MEQVWVVVDTNVWVAAGFRRRSVSARLVDLIREGHVRLVWDEATHRETKRILSKIPPLSWEDIAALFRPEDQYEGEIDPSQFAYVPDPDDRKFAALAAAVGVPLITMDDHLLAERARAPMAILTPREFTDWHALSQ